LSESYIIEIYAPERGVRTNRGVKWTRITSGLPALGFFESLYYHDSTHTIYGAVSSRGVFRSVDSGISWEQINCGLTDTIAMSLSRNWANNLMTAIRDQEVFQLNGTCWTALASERFKKERGKK
jgi:hypothetical protein